MFLTSLHLLARSGQLTSISYEAPFFLVNGRLLVLLKYSTKNRSPWGFTFTPDEQALLRDRAGRFKTILGLICGSDGVASFPYESYLEIASLRQSSVHVACFRRFGEHYEVSGPDGTLDGKVPPSNWRRVLDEAAR